MKKQYIVECGTNVFAQSHRGSHSGPLLANTVFEEKELVAADLEFMTFNRGFTNYTFNPADVRVVILDF
jgi:hypothetical protein